MLRRIGRNEYDRVAIIRALNSLAENTGFTDYEKFELAMEAEAVKDLSNGPDIVEINEFKFSLSFNELGEPVFESKKNGIPVRTIPKKFATDEQVKKLKARVKQIKKQTTRLRRYLEEAMCSRKPFNSVDLQNLLAHPILKVMMENLVFESSKGMGFLEKTGKSLRFVNGNKIPLDNNDILYVTHPIDLLSSGKWPLWQHDCFENGIVQPFNKFFEKFTLSRMLKRTPIINREGFMDNQ